MFTAIHPDFYTDETPYLLTSVELPAKSSEREASPRRL
jgi:hypothetical protein